MKRFNSLRIIALLITVYTTINIAYSQKKPIKFGEIDINDLKMEVYGKDTTAGAVVLCDYGKTYFQEENSFSLVHIRHTRIKILTKAGLDWANVKINRWGEISEIKASTYNLVDGQIEETRFSKKEIYKEKVEGITSAYKIALSKVQVGSIIEYSYVSKSNAFYGFRGWAFQNTIPIKWSEYRAEFNNNFYYQRKFQGNAPLSVIDNTGRVFRWVAEDVPAFKKEKYVRTIDDYVTRIDFELNNIKDSRGMFLLRLGTWENIINLLMENSSYGKWISGEGVKKKVKEITAGLETPQQKLEAIHSFVINNIKWNKENKMFASHSASYILKEKIATSGEINLLLLAMLKVADIDVYPVILSTRDNGRIKTFAPELSGYNYVTCQAIIDGKNIFVDGTDPKIPLGSLPPRCMNGRGLNVGIKKIEKLTGLNWIDLEKGISSTSNVSAILTLNDEGILSGSISKSDKGLSAYSIRKSYEKDGNQAFLEKAQNEYNDSNIDNFKIENIENLKKSVKTSFKVELEEHAEVLDDVIYLDPMVGFELTENPFKQEERNHAIELESSKSKSFVISITVPEGFVIENKPEDLVMSLPQRNGKFIHKIAQVGNRIQVLSKVVLGQSTYLPNEYGSLKEFYNQVISKQSEKIVLKRRIENNENK